MPKVLIYDIDRGLKSLASDDRIEQIFGYKPRRFIRAKTLLELFDKLHVPSVVQSEDALGLIEEEVYNVANGHIIDFEVLDSITAHQAQKKNELKGKSSHLNLSQWSELGEAVEEVVLKLCRTNTNVIIIGHTKSEEDTDLGIIRQVPALSGRMKDEISRYFDIVAYTHVITDDKGRREYLWQVVADERRDAKCRIEEVARYAVANGGYIPQDFEILWNKIKEGGHKAIKMLILGGSGTGKTYSLRTLKSIK